MKQATKFERAGGGINRPRLKGGELGALAFTEIAPGTTYRIKRARLNIACFQFQTYYCGEKIAPNSYIFSLEKISEIG